jgi:RHS repeat-associated protein
MASLAGALNAPATRYRYDAEHLLVCTGAPSTPLWRYWQDGVVVNVVENDTELSWAYCGGQHVATLRNGDDAVSTLLGADPAGSILAEADTELRSRSYAPYGHVPLDDPEPHPAYNGELLDTPSGCYLLGAGNHRPYSPTLQYFLAPDPFSPFDEGGLNAYAYCAGDPINRNDPSGHFWKWIVAGLSVVAAVASMGALAVPLIAGSAALTASAVAGFGFSALGAAAEVGALIADATGDETAGNILGWVGLGISAVGMVSALPAIAKAGSKAVKGLGRSLRSGSKATESMPLVPVTGSAADVTSTTTSYSSMTLEAPTFRFRAKTPRQPRPAPRRTYAPQVARPDAKPMRSIAFNELPNEEQRTVLNVVHQNTDAIKRPLNDGVKYANNGGALPLQKHGFYREYTVEDVTTANRKKRGLRRIIVGGQGRHKIKSLHTTDDHYDEFLDVRIPANGRWPRYPKRKRN